MATVRFATTCDKCIGSPARSTEYTRFPECRECISDVCPEHEMPKQRNDETNKTLCCDCAGFQYRCKDDPERNGRKPIAGEQRFTLSFPLEDGSRLQLHMGREGMNHFENFIANMMIDDSNESPKPHQNGPEREPRQ